MGASVAVGNSVISPVTEDLSDPQSDKRSEVDERNGAKRESVTSGDGGSGEEDGGGDVDSDGWMKRKVNWVERERRREKGEERARAREGGGGRERAESVKVDGSHESKQENSADSPHMNERA